MVTAHWNRRRLVPLRFCDLLVFVLQHLTSAWTLTGCDMRQSRTESSRVRSSPTLSRPRARRRFARLQNGNFCSRHSHFPDVSSALSSSIDLVDETSVSTFVYLSVLGERTELLFDAHSSDPGFLGLPLDRIDRRNCVPEASVSSSFSRSLVLALTSDDLSQFLNHRTSGSSSSCTAFSAHSVRCPSCCCRRHLQRADLCLTL